MLVAARSRLAQRSTHLLASGLLGALLGGSLGLLRGFGDLLGGRLGGRGSFDSFGGGLLSSGFGHLTWLWFVTGEGGGAGAAFEGRLGWGGRVWRGQPGSQGCGCCWVPPPPRTCGVERKQTQTRPPTVATVFRHKKTLRYKWSQYLYVNNFFPGPLRAAGRRSLKGHRRNSEVPNHFLV